jgi:hypothetical protein
MYSVVALANALSGILIPAMVLLIGAFLVGNAVAALMEQVCSGPLDRTIDPWLRSRPMSMHIAPTSLVVRGLARVGK